MPLSPLKSVFQRPGLYAATVLPTALVALLVLRHFDNGEAYHNPVLLGCANFTFLTLASWVVAFLAARSFLVRPTPSLLMLASGALAWGAGGATTLIAVHDANDQMTIYNTCALLAGVLHLCGQAYSWRGGRTIHVPGRWLFGAVSAIVGFVTLLTIAAVHDATPMFYVPGSGPTLLRTVVLASAITTFCVTGLVMLFRRPTSIFFQWYALALLLLGAGLLGVFLQIAYDSLQSWTGRSIQWLGGAFMLVAALRGAGDTRVWGIAMEHALASARKKTTDVLEAIGDCFVAFDHEWRFSYVNAAAEKLLGPRERVLGRKYDEVFPAAAEHTRMRDLGDAVAEGKSVHYEVCSPSFNRWLECHAYPNPEGMWVFFRDITETRAAREALRDSEERLGRALESSPNGYFIYDADRRFTYVNPAGLRFLGRALSDVLGRRNEDLLPAGSADAWLPHLERAYETRQPEHFECLATAAHGAEQALAISYVPLLRDDGSVREVLGISIDVTAQKQTEKMLRSAVEERTANLQKAVEDLEHFSYAIAHDMRAPLRAMAGFSELLIEEVGAGDTTHLLPYLERIKRASIRMDDLITGGLAYGKAARQEIELTPVSTDTVIRGLLDTYPNLGPEKADIAIEGPLPVVIGSEVALTQCFSNLLDNAVKFVAPGVRPRVVIRSEPQGERLRIWVIDNGIGIPKAQQHRLFEIFSQLTTSYGGTGVGLAVVRRMLRGMGGEVGVESDEGEGSRFWIELKLWREPSGGTEAPGASGAVRPGEVHTVA